MFRIETHEDLLAFYRTHTEASSPGRHADRLEDLPSEMGALCRVLQGSVVHMWWIGEKTYGFTRDDLKSDGRDILAEIGLRSAGEMLEWIVQHDPRPLVERREPRERLVGNCRDYSLLLASILRQRGIPARARTGVARYFYSDGSKLEDHWICEWWNEATGRWRQTDAQIDELMRDSCSIEFDPQDLPAGQFLTGWECYEEVAAGRVEPRQVGFGDEFNGLAYARHKLLVDLHALSGSELLPWEGWGIGGFEELSCPGDDELLHELLEILKRVNEPAYFQRAMEVAASNDRVRRPSGYDAGPFREEWLD